jgi:REP-associated tyrosine transposase
VLNYEITGDKSAVMSRPLRIEYRGAVYHVLCRGNNRQKIFRDDLDRKWYLERLAYYCEVKEVALLGYCLLSNHIHLLVETPQGNLSKMMQAFQTSYTLYSNRRHGRSGHVFEQRYKALLVDKDNYLLQVSRYIHRNPVEAKLVGRPQDYRWSSYGAYVNAKAVRGLSTSLVLEQLRGKRREQIRNYREYVESDPGLGVSEEPPPTIKGVVIGDTEFAEEVLNRRRRRVVMERGYTLGEVEQAVCRVARIKREELGRAQRRPAVKRARELFMYLGRHHTGANLREIADRLGVRDISTVSHGEKRVAKGLRESGAGAKELKRVLNETYSLIQA